MNCTAISAVSDIPTNMMAVYRSFEATKNDCNVTVKDVCFVRNFHVIQSIAVKNH